MADDTQIGPRIDASLYDDYKWFVESYNDAYKGRLSKEIQQAMRSHMGLVLVRDLPRIVNVENDEQRSRLLDYVEEFVDHLEFTESQIGDPNAVREEIDRIRSGDYQKKPDATSDSEPVATFKNEYPTFSNDTQPQADKQTNPNVRNSGIELPSNSEPDIEHNVEQHLERKPTDSDDRDPAGRDVLWEKILTLQKRVDELDEEQSSSAKQ